MTREHWEMPQRVRMPKASRFSKTEREGSCPLPEEAAGFLYHASNVPNILCCGYSHSITLVRLLELCRAGRLHHRHLRTIIVCLGQRVDRVCRHVCASSEHSIIQERCRRRWASTLGQWKQRRRKTTPIRSIRTNN